MKRSFDNILGSPFVTLNYSGIDNLNFTVGPHLQLISINGKSPLVNGDTFESYNFTLELLDHSMGGKKIEWVFYSLNTQYAFFLNNFFTILD